jgi:hypothetical protein
MCGSCSIIGIIFLSQLAIATSQIAEGMQNVTDEDPPFVAGSFENGYDESLATIKGRFWYVGLKKRF